MNAWLEAGLSNALVATGLAVVAAIVTRVSPNPRIAFAAWSLVLLKLVMPPIPGVPAAVWQVTAEQASETNDEAPRPLAASLPMAPMQPATVPAGERSNASPAAASITTDSEVAPRIAASRPIARSATAPADPPLAYTAIRPWPWPRIVAAVWLTGSLAWLFLAIGRTVRFESLLRRTHPADERLTAEVATLARRLGLTRTIQVRITRAAVSPLVWVWFRRATILLPERLLASLSQEQRTTLLAHELVHLARRDHWVRWLELAAIALYWWHPVAWWARRNLARAGEQCCDGGVVRLLPELVADYARTLLVATDFCSDSRPALPAGSSGFSQGTHLKRRMKMILASRVSHTIGWPGRLALAAVALVALPLSLRSAAAEPAPQTKTKPVLLAQAAKAKAAGTGSLEERIAKLEKAVAELTAVIQSLREAEAANASPVVVKTIPETGAEDVDPSLTELKVTFSKDMQNGSWSWTQRSDDTFPQTTGSPHYLDDKRTCVLPVKLEPGKTYWISLNSNRFKNFKDPGGRPAVPHVLTFKTKAE